MSCPLLSTRFLCIRVKVRVFRDSDLRPLTGLVLRIRSLYHPIPHITIRKRRRPSRNIHIHFLRGLLTLNPPRASP